MSVDSKFLPIKCLLITERKGAALQGGAWLTATRSTQLDTTRRMQCDPICSDCEETHTQTMDILHNTGSVVFKTA